MAGCGGPLMQHVTWNPVGSSAEQMTSEREKGP